MLAHVAGMEVAVAARVRVRSESSPAGCGQPIVHGWSPGSSGRHLPSSIRWVPWAATGLNAKFSQWVASGWLNWTIGCLPSLILPARLDIVPAFDPSHSQPPSWIHSSMSKTFM
jgi:hypothetical protein